ncbi:tetratricopeptide repeat-containing sensor histidine kinase [Mucilaginibacter sp. UR6-11]|uniref:tetratricopeptide repeat-containing sensor histidine kinase n=1 Tax=Mucilaginibacter sp. UR6-11 TaxID=1435644 RepID=UPI001E29929A|nr:tetratricopeptide repeat-containing sensor histidine kinase [Mucilaginibacter sp. UR6-11]MCC8426156.1 tetratricopeptide repeat-containing sensor histidine kinase [Mucilaginibacter sp. UR6-11]
MGLLLLLISGCRQVTTERQGNSAEFKRITKRLDTFFGNNRVEQGMRLLDSTKKYSNNLTLLDRYQIYGFRYFYYQRTAGGNKKALLYADTMLAIAGQSTDARQRTALYVDANFALGDAYFALQQYDEAYQHLFKGYQVGRNTLNKVVLSFYMYRMGMITYKMGNYNLANSYFKKSYNYYTVIPGDFVNFYHAQELLDNIALSYKHNNQPDSAILYFDRSLQFINKYGPNFKDRLKMIDIARGVVYGNKAEVLVQQGNYQQAIELLKKSILINLQKNYDNNDAELSEIKLARLYYDHHQDNNLFSLLTTIGRQLDSVKNPEVEASWNQLMSQYYLRQNKLPEALRYLQAYNTIKDSNIKKLNLLKASDINKQLENFENQQQIERLSSNNKTQRVLLYVIIIVALMALIIVFLVYRNWKRSKKDVLTVKLLNRQINEQNGELENALNELKLSSQEKDRILRTVAHDLRNPIGGIASLTSILANDDCTEEQIELINLVKETSYNSLELINEILEATNATSMELKVELTEINSLVNNSVELLRFKASEKGQKIFYEPLHGPLQLLISREKIWRVISNLISNAIKFSPPDAPIFVKVAREAGQVVISVLDNGIGIPDDLKDQVFNMFTVAQRPGTSGEKSFGLGLSICKQIMEKSHGKIWFDSGKHGTIFFISLPIPAEDSALKESSAQQTGIPQS